MDWMDALLRTDPIDHAVAELLLKELYAAVGLADPGRFLWHESPLDALWTFTALSENHDHMTRQFAQFARQKKDSLAALLKHQQETAGRWQKMEPPVTEGGSLLFRIMQLRTTSMMNVAGMDAYMRHSQQPSAEWSDLQALERQVFGHFGDGTLAYGAARFGAESVRSWMGATPYRDYSLTTMARDEQYFRQHRVSPPKALEAIWAVSKMLPVWWPFEKAVVLAERPVRVEGATFTYSDGFVAAPYTAITRKTVAKSAKDAKVMSLELPYDGTKRIAVLRNHSPALPFLDRYIAGEREAVWKELVDLGPQVRSDKYAADALAVAYETMDRARRNVEILCERLRVKWKRSGSWKAIQKLEKRLGPLPLSLRAFYDLVGEIDLMGVKWPDQDPLVVYGPKTVLDEDEEDAITIAPDALHKANTSGGDPYSIAMPCASADAPVEGVPGDLNFVEYLRLVFQWGGFPGWQDADAVLPPELEELRKGLLPI